MKQLKSISDQSLFDDCNLQTKTWPVAIQALGLWDPPTPTPTPQYYLDDLNLHKF